jgi:peroxiredoxin Q/BCP
MIQVGEKIPEILGLDQDGKELKMSDFKGKKLVLYFYPKDQTAGCIAEACSFRDNLSALANAGYAVVGVSKDSQKSHLNFIAKQNLNFPLISDPEKSLIEYFGVWGEKKMCGKVGFGVIRTTFIINEEGVVERIIEKVNTKQAAQQVLEA